MDHSVVTRGREAGYFVLNHDCAIVLLGAGVDRVPVLVLQLDAEPRDARARHVVRVFDGVDRLVLYDASRLGVDRETTQCARA